jgi:hypothetical protein
LFILAGVLFFRVESQRVAVFLWSILVGVPGGPPKELRSEIQGIFAVFLIAVIMLSLGYIYIRSQIFAVRDPIGGKIYSIDTFRPVAIVRDGRRVDIDPARWADNNESPPQVALVDSGSMVVLVASLETGGSVIRRSLRWLIWQIRPWMQKLERALGRPAIPVEVVRIAGPGIIRIPTNWKIRDVVSLGEQTRKVVNLELYTRDSIRVKTTVIVRFTISDCPRVSFVTYVGDSPDGPPVLAPANLRLVDVDYRTRIVRNVRDDLDEADRIEIHQSIKHEWKVIEAILPVYPLKLWLPQFNIPPYTGSSKRVFKAVRSQGLMANETRLDDWLDLPVLEATRIFRDLVARWYLDDLFLPEDPVNLPLNTRLRPELSQSLRSLGHIVYQMVRFRDPNRSIKKGDRLSDMDCVAGKEKALENSKLLRDRGIEIIATNFTELTPDQPIRAQRLDNWRSQWQRDDLIKEADLDLEIIRVRNRARVQAQREMIYTLDQILAQGALSKEAMAINIFQALDQAAIGPANRRLLPRDAIILLNQLRRTVLQDDSDRVEG